MIAFDERRHADKGRFGLYAPGKRARGLKILIAKHIELGIGALGPGDGGCHEAARTAFALADGGGHADGVEPLGLGLRGGRGADARRGKRQGRFHETAT